MHAKGSYLQEKKRESKPEPIQPNQTGAQKNRNESGASIHAKSKNRIEYAKTANITDRNSREKNKA